MAAARLAARPSETNVSRKVTCAGQDLRTVLDAGDDPDLVGLQDWAVNRTYPDLD